MSLLRAHRRGASCPKDKVTLRDYEIVYIFHPSLEEERVNEKITRFHGLIAGENGGEIAAVDHWGRRQLAYPIEDQTSGYYVVAHFNTDGALLPEFERILKLDEELSAHVAWLRDMTGAFPAPLVLVGRSFGGRLAIRLAAERALAAVVLLGFPIRPPGKRRVRDEEALSALKTPTLIVQGTKDQLGPLRVLKPLVAANPHLTLHEIAGAGHSFGAKSPAALDFATSWLTSTLGT